MKKLWVGRYVGMGCLALAIFTSSIASAQSSGVDCANIIPEPATLQLEQVARCSVVLDHGPSTERDGAFYFISKMDVCLVKGSTALFDTYYVLSGSMERISVHGTESDVALQVRFKSWDQNDRLYGNEILHLIHASIGTDPGKRFKRIVGFDPASKILQFNERAQIWGYVSDPRWFNLVNVTLQCN